MKISYTMLFLCAAGSVAAIPPAMKLFPRGSRASGSPRASGSRSLTGSAEAHGSMGSPKSGGTGANPIGSAKDKIEKSSKQGKLVANPQKFGQRKPGNPYVRLESDGPAIGYASSGVKGEQSITHRFPGGQRAILQAQGPSPEARLLPGDPNSKGHTIGFAHGTSTEIRATTYPGQKFAYLRKSDNRQSSTADVPNRGIGREHHEVTGHASKRMGAELDTRVDGPAWIYAKANIDNLDAHGSDGKYTVDP